MLKSFSTVETYKFPSKTLNNGRYGSVRTSFRLEFVSDWLLFTLYRNCKIRYAYISRSDFTLQVRFRQTWIPDIVRSDNVKQFEITTTIQFHQFAKTYQFKHMTSNRIYPQNNGLVETAVKMIKLKLKKNPKIFNEYYIFIELCLLRMDIIQLNTSWVGYYKQHYLYY